MKKRIVFTVLILFAAIVVGCYQKSIVKLMTDITYENLTGKVSRQVKVHLKDNSVVRFPGGFTVSDSSIAGTEYRTTQSGSAAVKRKIPIDSITAVVYYEKGAAQTGMNVGTSIASLAAAPIAFFGYYCLFCPKCCFGSCPTVYTEETGDTVLTAELFSTSIAAPLEKRDIDLLSGSVTGGKPWKMRITNEALETHWINSFKIAAVPHSAGEMICPDANGSLISASSLKRTDSSFSEDGKSVSSLIASFDSSAYRTDESFALRQDDWIELNIPTPAKDSLALIINSRNTLLSTILLYEVVLGSQGIHAVEWLEKLNTDKRYAAQFDSVYHSFSGIRLSRFDGREWVECGYVGDSGPIAWKYSAAVVPVDREQPVQRYRLHFFPDNQLINQVSYTELFHRIPTDSLTVLSPEKITAGSVDKTDSFGALLADSDSLYLETNPGNQISLTFRLPHSERPLALFALSQGHYTEWIRGSWIHDTNRESSRFSLANINQTVFELSEKWRRSRGDIEAEFYKNRVPVKKEWE